MRSAMSHAMAGWIVGCLTVLSACGESHSPDADSETHFLVRCDGECEDGLSCLCGVCTASCERDDDCSELSSAASCQAAADVACSDAKPKAAVCEVTCRDDADCAAVGAEHRCEAGACRAASSSPKPDAGPAQVCGIDDQAKRGTTERVASSAVYDSYVNLVTGTDEGAAFIDPEGRVMTLALEDAAPIPIWEPAAGAMPMSVLSLVSDGATLFWIAATPPEPSPLPDPTFPMPPCFIERIGIDGSDRATVLRSDDRVFYGLRLDADDVYFGDDSEMQLWRMGRDDTTPEIVLTGSLGRLTRLGDYFYYLADDGAELLRRHVQTGEVQTALAAADQPKLANGDPMLSRLDDLQAAADVIVLVTSDPRAPDGVPDQTISTFDPESGCLHVLAVPDTGITWPLRPDGDVVYWKGFAHGGISPGDPEPGARIWRTDLASGESVELEPDDLAVGLTTDVVGQDASNVYVTTGDDLIRIAK